jgi:hypothetical protein
MGNLAFQFQQDIIAKMKYFQYKIIASHMFHWTGLPPGLTSEKLELMLIDRGSLALFNTIEGIFILPYTSDGHLNIYGDLLAVRPMPINGEQLTQIDAVPRILWDNSVRQTFNSYLLAFSHRLAEIQKSIAILERQARLPSIIKMREEDKESWARLESKVDEGYPVLFVDEALNTESRQVMPSGFAPQVLEALWNDYNKVEGEVYALLGTMFNVEQNKAAGVGPAETIINYSQTFAIANSRLQQRQDWCERINAEFKSNIQCERARDLEEIIQQVMQGQLTPGEEQPAGREDADNARNRTE